MVSSPEVETLSQTSVEPESNNITVMPSVESAEPEVESEPERVTPEPEPSTATSHPEENLGEDDLREQVLTMQSHLGTILESVTEIKNNCTRLKTENQFIQEYIETLLSRR